jgi:hypothetical protein
LAEVGWPDALAVDAYPAISLLFTLQGAANATSSALDRVVVSGLGLTAAEDAAVVLPAMGSWAAPADQRHGVLTVAGLGTPALGRATTALVISRGAESAPVMVTRVDVAALDHRAVHGIDPAFGLVEVTGHASPFAVVAETEAQTWDHAVARAHLAIGHELVGAARAMLDMAREHALNRVQFGQPIGRFQAVRHRLADTLVAIEAAEAVLSAAGGSLTSSEFGAPGDSGGSVLAAAGKALAGRGARTAARHCQQVLAGIGFTAEHPFHRYLRRVLVLDQLFGTARALTEALGREILATRRIAHLLPL